ncbi:MAG TPA: hypothetical protein VN845_02735, partial [Solirubrobacteraceae bacterium]|nr:hypothetical protein [Solirubrobacteraceae bacterium]
GALGIAPAQHHASPRGASHATEATSVLASTTRVQEGSGRGGAVVPRQPRRGPARAAEPAPVAAAQARSGARRGGLRRLALAVLLLLALGGIIAAVVVLTAPAPTKITLQRVVYEDAQESAEALKQLVQNNSQ